MSSDIILWICEPASSVFSHPQDKALKRIIASMQDITLHICHDHQQAIKCAEQLTPSLILQSMHMQAAHGLDLLQCYKNHVVLADIAVVMVANNDSNMIRDFAFFRGCDDYIETSVGKLEWQTRLRKLLQTQQLHTHDHNTSIQLKEAKQRLKTCKKSLEELATHDSLTGIANRQAFSQHYEREWSRALRETEPLSVLIVNIDHFKAYNDSYGYQQGDRCLQKISRLLQNIFQRPTDFYARYCGEEFIVLLPMTHAQGGIYMAEKLRKAVLTLGIEHKSSKTHQHLTLSLGLGTTSPMLKHKSRDLIRIADQARFEAKQQGRNRLICKSI